MEEQLENLLDSMQMKKVKIFSFGPLNFSWSNVDGEVIYSIIDKSLAFRSLIELEFLNAL